MTKTLEDLDSQYPHLPVLNCCKCRELLTGPSAPSSAAKNCGLRPMAERVDGRPYCATCFTSLRQQQEEFVESLQKESA